MHIQCQATETDELQEKKQSSNYFSQFYSLQGKQATKRKLLRS